MAERRSENYAERYGLTQVRKTARINRMINRLAIFGVGLIGGSLALALRENDYVKTIIGCSRNREHLQKAVKLGAIDDFTLDPAEAVSSADMVLLAVPMGAMEKVLGTIAGHLSPGAVVTDAGSSKASVVAAAESVFGELPSFFVPGHPIAGREKSGVEAALADLYVDHKVILTPHPNTSASAIERVTKMWQAAGATVKTLGIQQHDLVLAATSHLPHVVAYSLVDTISKTEYVEQIFEYAAGGFRDSSRTASSDPVMWRDICLENKTAILDVLADFEANFSQLRKLIEESDSDKLLEIFTHAKTVRDANVMKARPKK